MVSAALEAFGLNANRARRFSFEKVARVWLVEVLTGHL